MDTWINEIDDLQIRQIVRNTLKIKIDRVYSVIYIYNPISAGQNLAHKEKKTNTLKTLKHLKYLQNISNYFLKKGTFLKV